MKNWLSIFVVIALISSACCSGNSDQKTEQDSTELTNQAVVVNADQFEEVMQQHDNLELTLTGSISDVCQMSGCWLEIALPSGNVVLVTFPDSVYVAPKDIAGSIVTVSGLASKEIIPVQRLQLQAADEGASEEEINAIDTPRTEYGLEAVRVILQ